MGNTIEVDNELDHITQTHTQTEKRKSAYGLDDIDQSSPCELGTEKGNAEHALSEVNSPAIEDRYDALNESSTVLPSTIKLADLIV